MMVPKAKGLSWTRARGLVKEVLSLKKRARARARRTSPRQRSRVQKLLLSLRRKLSR